MLRQHLEQKQLNSEQSSSNLTSFLVHYKFLLHNNYSLRVREAFLEVVSSLQKQQNLKYLLYPFCLHILHQLFLRLSVLIEYQSRFDQYKYEIDHQHKYRTDRLPLLRRLHKQHIFFSGHLLKSLQKQEYYQFFERHKLRVGILLQDLVLNQHLYLQLLDTLSSWFLNQINLISLVCT